MLGCKHENDGAVSIKSVSIYLRTNKYGVLKGS